MRKRLTEQIRAAVEASGQTRADISRATGIDEARLSRFVKGQRGLSYDALDMLADHLGLAIVVRRKPKKPNR